MCCACCAVVGQTTVTKYLQITCTMWSSTSRSKAVDAEDLRSEYAEALYSLGGQAGSDCLAHLMLQQVQLKRRQITFICGEVLGQQKL